MRGAVAGSAMVHLAIMAALMIVQSNAPKLMVGPDAIQVALLEVPASAAAIAPAPPERAPEKAPELVAEPGTGVKIAAEKPKPKAKTEEPQKPQPNTPPAALPAAPMGRPGLSGDVAVDAGNFEFSYYLLLIRNRIAQNWSPPAGLVSSGAPVRAVVYFRIERDGSLSGVKLEGPSGAEFFDRSSLRAVRLSDPMPPLPTGFSGNSLGVHFGFGYTAP